MVCSFAPVARALSSCEQRATFLAGTGGAGIRDAILAEFEAGGCSVISLDVFDTFLLRNATPETERFFDIAASTSAQLQAMPPAAGTQPPGALDLLLARLHAAELGYRTRPALDGCREGHIREIVRVATLSLGLQPDAAKLMLDAELACEAANLALNTVLLDVVESVRKAGGRAILISDMYLGEPEISALIERLAPGVSKLFSSIYSSADITLNKRSGKAYPHVSGQMALPPRAFMHVGDAWHADVMRSREAGWNAVHFPVSEQELAGRRHNLALFMRRMAEQGIDLSRWAKI